MRLVLAALVAVVMGCAIAGVGMGEAPAERERAPSSAQTAAAADRIADHPQGGRLFADAGCDHCHSIAAADADGKLGPRLDPLDEDAEDIAESIAEPREDAADGYPGKLMPTDYSQRLDDAEIRALAAFVAAASGAEGEDGDDDSGRGRNRGRRAAGAAVHVARAPTRRQERVTRRAARGGAAITRRSSRAP